MADTIATYPQLQRLSVPVSPNLEIAFGYEGDREWVCFYHKVCGSEVFYNDGDGAREGYADAYISFLQHPTVRPHIRKLERELGLDAAARLRVVLLLHRLTRTLYVADFDDALARVWSAKRSDPTSRVSREAYQEKVRILSKLDEGQLIGGRSVADVVLEEHSKQINDLSDWLSSRPERFAHH